MTAIEFTVAGVAQPKGSARAFVPKGHTRPIVVSDNPSLKAWEHLVQAELQRVMSETDQTLLLTLFDAPIAIALTFHLPRPKSAPARVLHHLTRPDLDKCIRGLIDALSGVAFRDDSRVVSIRAEKVFAHASAKVDIRIELVQQLGVSVGVPPSAPALLPLTTR